MNLKIKEEFAQKVIAFDGAGALPIGQYSIDRLTKLAITAHQSGNKSLIELFDGPLPSLQELQRAQTQKAIRNIK